MGVDKNTEEWKRIEVVVGSDAVTILSVSGKVTCLCIVNLYIITIPKYLQSGTVAGDIPVGSG